MILAFQLNFLIYFELSAFDVRKGLKITCYTCTPSLKTPFVETIVAGFGPNAYFLGSCLLLQKTF